MKANVILSEAKDLLSFLHAMRFLAALGMTSASLCSVASCPRTGGELKTKERYP